MTTTNKEVHLNILRQLAGLAPGASQDTSQKTVHAYSRPNANTSRPGHTQKIQSAVAKLEASYKAMKKAQQNLVAAYRDLADMGHV